MFITCVKYNVYFPLKALSHGAIFLATCDQIVLLGDVKLANTSFHHRLLIYFNIPNICHKFTSLQRIALQEKLHRVTRPLLSCRLSLYKLVLALG